MLYEPTISCISVWNARFLPIRSPLAKRLARKRRMSNSCYWPVVTNPATIAPIPRESLKPWPLKPTAT